MLRFVFILFFISLQAHAVNKVTVCDSCDAASMKSISTTVFYWNESGYSYVVDRNSRISRKFKIETVYIKEGPDYFPVHQSTEVATSQQEKQAFQEIYRLVDMFHSDISVSGGQIQLQKSSGILDPAFVSAMSNTPSGSVTVLSPADLTAQDFLLDSSIRNKTFDLHFAARINTYAASVNYVTDILNVPGFDLKSLKLSYKIVFPDGSFVFAVPNISTSTTDVVEGSARDSNGNTIPATADLASGRYHFSSEAAYREMNDYLNIRFGAKVEFKICRTYVMTCTFNNNTLTCSVPTCNL